MTWADWPLVWVGDEPQIDETVMAAARAAAQSMLWSRTGRRLGSCSVTEGYVMPSNGNACGMPYLGDDLVWRDGVGPGGHTIWLAGEPVQSVTAVRVSGATVDPSAYELRGSALVRVDGNRWPSALASDPTIVEVDYVWGVSLGTTDELTALVSLAMGEVTTELIAGMTGRPCKLPSRAVTITRQGVTVQLGDPQTYIDNMLLGLPLADQLILTTNPGRRRQRSRVHSPDMPRSHRIAAP